MEDATIPDDEVVDPGGRDGCRAPIPWTRVDPHGWIGEVPWLPWAPHSADRSVEAMRENPSSILHLYKRIIAARAASRALTLGSIELLTTPDDILGYERFDEASGDRRVMLINFGDRQVLTPGYQGTKIEVDSASKMDGDAFDGVMAPGSAVILAP